LPKSGIDVPLLVHIVRSTSIVYHLENAHHSGRTRRL
jgi:hypothetical protein